MVKFILSTYFKQSGQVARAQAIEKKLGFNPIDWSLLTRKNFGPWALNTLMFISLLEEDYFVKRIQYRLKHNPKYPTHMLVYSPLFHDSIEDTLSLLKRLDEAAQKATGDIFPDDLFNTTFPPEGGPYYDLLQAIISEKTTVPIELIDPAILSMGLEFSESPKRIDDLRTITKRDIAFLAEFIIELSKRKELVKKLIPFIDQSEIFVLFLVAVSPEKRLRYLDFDKGLVNQCLDDLDKIMTLYEENPEETLKTLHMKLPMVED